VLVPAAEPEPDAAGPKLRLVTTVAPITSIVAAVAGERGEVRGLVPEGTNSHTFEPPPSAAKVLANADVVFMNGLRLEEPTKKLATSTMDDDALLVEIGDAVLPESDYLYDFSFPEDEGKPNPHLWTDPTYAIRYADKIRDVLAERDPASRLVYDRNYDAFSRQATALSDALRADQESIAGPKQLLTYHDAYAYFAKTYGWQVVGAVQPEDFSEPTAREIARLIEQIEEADVPTIFGSEVFPSKALEEIGDQTGARYSDTLRDDDLPGEPGDPEHSWLGLMRYNFVTMVTGLGGEPERLRTLDVTPAVPDDAEYPQ
jgi:ABC-type Zn uptake system ZnuABC Zn-binding protein ZnuA